jgi:hypothetical protein
MNASAKRIATLGAALVFFVVACLLFPRVLAFTELAARELRYLWWLVLMVALGVWLAFFSGRRRP